MQDEQFTEIGPRTLVKGDIESNEVLAVFGQVEGKILSNSSVSIEEGGFVTSVIEAETIIVAGEFQGEAIAADQFEISAGGLVGSLDQDASIQAARILIAGDFIGEATASEIIEIASTGRVLGTLKTPRLVMDDGALVDGDVLMDGLSKPEPVAQPTRTSRTTTQTQTRRGFTRKETTTKTGSGRTAVPVPIRRPARPVYEPEPVSEVIEQQETDDTEE